MRHPCLKKILIIVSLSLMEEMVRGQMTLPIVKDFSSVINDAPPSLPSGFSHTGLSGYSGALKFDDTGDFVIMHFTGTPGTLFFELGVNNAFPGTIPATAIFTVEESTDGLSWSTLSTYTNISGGTKTLNPALSSQYIRWIYTTKPSGTNIALKNLQLTDALNTYPFYRSKNSGDWNDYNSWQISPDGISWVNATNSYPTNFSDGISISMNHVITLTNHATARKLTIDAGGTLTNTNTSGGYQLTIIDEGTSAFDFTINGLYILFGTGPVFNSGAVAIVNSGGLVRADNNGGAGQSDAFASSANVTFKTGSVFEWNNTNAFATSGIIYFPNASNEIPIFSVGPTAIPNITSAGILTINGVFDIRTDINFSAATGARTFRDGITGNSTLTIAAGGSGAQRIDGGMPVLGGSNLTIISGKDINIPNGITVPADSTVTVSGASSFTGKASNNFIISGTVNMTTFNIVNSGGAVIVNNRGILKTGSSDGLFGVSSSTISSGTVTLNTGSTIEYNAAVAQKVQGTAGGLSAYYNITLSGGGTKTISPANPSVINGTLTIPDNTIVDVSNNTFGGAATNFVMNNGRFRTAGTSTKPDIAGTYNLTGGVVEFYNNLLTSENIRSKSYQNIEVSGSSVGNSNGNIRLNSYGTFTIKGGGVFTINSDAITGPDGSQLVTVESGGVFNCGNFLGFYGALSGINSPSVRDNIETVTLQPGSVINYSGNGNQIITNTVPYQNLILSGTGNKTAPTGILEIKGDISKSGTAVFAHNNGTVLINGPSAQTYTSTSPQMEFYNLINNNLLGLNVNDSLSVYRLLTLKDGSAITLNKDITLRSDKNNTASFDKNNTGIINYGSGRFIVERFINTDIAANGGHHKSWQFIAAPAFGETILNTWQEGGSTTITKYGTWITDPSYPSNGFDGVSLTPSMKSYNTLTNSWDGISGTTINLENPKGYMLFVRGDRQARNIGATPTPTVLRTRGKLYTGSESPVSTVAVGQLQSIGNPYASAIDFTKISKTNIDNNFYVWDPSLLGNYGVGGYQTISGITGYVATPGGTSIYNNSSMDYRNIQSGQAFFVRNTSGSDGAVSFSESCKIEDGNHLVNRGPVPVIANRQLLFTDLFTADGNIADGNAVAFDNQFSDKIDKDDALKINNSGENFAITSHGKILSVEARQLLSFTDTVFYNMHNLQPKDYTLVFMPQNMEKTMDAYLIDQYLKTEHPVSLKDSSKIMFSVNSESTSAASNRFMLVFRAAAGPLPLTVITINALFKNEAVLVNWTVENEFDLVEHEIEHSADGIYFTSLSKVAAINTGRFNYEYSHDDYNDGCNYYRIKTLDKNGKIILSSIVKVVIKRDIPSIKVSRPLDANTIYLKFINQQAGKYKISLYNQSGQLLLMKEMMYGGGNSMQILKNITYSAHGVCYLEILKANKERQVILLIQ